MGFSKPKVDRSGLERQKKEAAAERKRLQAERDAAEKQRLASLEARNKQSLAIRRRAAGRQSLIANVGGELGTSDKLG